MRDLIWWQSCPHCGNRAALHWTDGQMVQWECLAGCQLTGPELRQLVATTVVPRMAAGDGWRVWEGDVDRATAAGRL